MNDTFSASFLRNKVRTTENIGDVVRPQIKSGTRIEEVLRSYVSPSEQIKAYGHRSANGNYVPNRGSLDANINQTISARRDIKNILSMNPNAELAIEIVVSGTISPNNTLDSQLQYKSSYDKLGPIKSKLLQDIKEIMNKHTDLEENLPKILRDAKYYVGSYAMLVVPTNHIREMIKVEKDKTKGDKNPSMILESISNSLSNLSYKGKRNEKYIKPSPIDIKLEDIGLPVETTKNITGGKFIVHGDSEILRINAMRNKVSDEEDVYGCLNQLESLSEYDPREDLNSLKQEGLTDAIIADSLDRARGYAYDDVINLHPNEDFESTDIATHMHIPHEAIFVLHQPGSPENHVGYYIVLDMSGNPISVEAELDIYMPAYSGAYSNDSSESAMAAQTNFAGGNMELGYAGYGNSDLGGRNLSDKTALFTKMMEKQLLEKIKSGHFKNNDISLAEHDELMRTMFSRYLSNKQTQLLFVPASLMTYTAFEYDDHGNGVSLIIKHRNIGVLNSILTLANTLSAINNTIDHKEVRIRFDDDELDFNKTTNMVIGNLARHTALNSSRLLNTDVNRQMDYIGIKGYQLAYDEHPGHPGTSVSIENLDRERTAPDSDTVENNQTLLIQSLGSTPEVVDMARNIEYASSYFQSNLQAARRAISDQKEFTKFLNKFIKCFILNSPLYLKKMILIVDKARAENPELRGLKTINVVKDFIDSITVHLPKPDMSKVELLDRAIGEYEKLVDRVLLYTIGEEALTEEDVGENLEEALKSLRVKIKGIMMREYLASNNMFQDNILASIYNSDEEELDAAMGRVESQQEFMLDFLKKHEIISSGLIEKANEEVAKIKEARGLDGEGGSSDFDNGPSTDSSESPDNNDATESEGGQATDSGDDPFA